jgi:hypothetical protein
MPPNWAEKNAVYKLIISINKYILSAIILNWGHKFPFAHGTKLTVKTTNIICAPPALATSTITVIAFRALYSHPQFGGCVMSTEQFANDQQYANY